MAPASGPRTVGSQAHKSDLDVRVPGVRSPPRCTPPRRLLRPLPSPARPPARAEPPLSRPRRALLARPAARRLGSHLVRADDAAGADAIVVLGGDVYKRAPHAASLYHQGLAPVVLAVGGTEDQGPLAEARKTARVLLRDGVPEAAVIVVGQAEPSTVDEARAVARVASAQAWRRVAVVTSPYHTWRAGHILEAELPPEVAVAMVPSPLDPFHAETWWRDARDRRLVRNEYGKYLLWRLGW